VDRLGGLDDAVDEARTRVALQAGTGGGGTPLPIRYLGPKPSVLEVYAQKFLPQWAGAMVAAQGQWPMAAAVAAASGQDADVLAAIGQDLQWLQEVLAQRQPFGAVAHCLCQVSP
jgi:hypothetical protein